MSKDDQNFANSVSANQQSGPTKRIQRSALRRFAPNRAILSVTPQGNTSVPIEDISPSRIGWKAVGLSALPPEWVPPYFVVESKCLEEASAGNVLNDSLETCVRTLHLDGYISGRAEARKRYGTVVV